MNIKNIIAIVAITLLLVSIFWDLFPMVRKGFRKIFK